MFKKILPWILGGAVGVGGTVLMKDDKPNDAAPIVISAEKVEETILDDGESIEVPRHPNIEENGHCVDEDGTKGWCTYTEDGLLRVFFPKISDEPDQEIIITEDTEPEKIYCPEVEPVICPEIPKCEPKIITKWKTVYKDRIIHVPTKVEPGCNVNWKTGEATGVSTRGLNLKCTINYHDKTVDTQYWDPNSSMGLD